MKISYAITVCNELEEIKRLLEFLIAMKRDEDEICVLLDKPKASQALIDLLYRHSSANNIILKESAFEGHFAAWKNNLTSMCTGDYIVNIDADEYPHENLIQSLPGIIEENSDVDVFLVPRVNTVEGITEQHIKRWRWYVNESGWINFPDYQWRIYKNIPTIEWTNKVHEVLRGFKRYAYLPQDEYFALFHPKTIEKQEKQNNFYDNI